MRWPVVCTNARACGGSTTSMTVASAIENRWGQGGRGRNQEVGSRLHSICTRSALRTMSREETRCSATRPKTRPGRQRKPRRDGASSG